MKEVTYGPIQLLVIVFENPDFHNQISLELNSVMDKGIIRLIDFLFLWKYRDGSIVSIAATELDEMERVDFGAFIGGLIGFGAGGKEGAAAGMEAGAMAAARENYGITDKDILEITEAIPENTAAAIFIIEHLWAKNLNQAISAAGGVLVSQGILTPELLTLVGKEFAEAAKSVEDVKSGTKTTI
jgi:uncharacterized membrane protein